MGHRITLRDLARGAVRTARKAPALAVAARVALRSDPDVCLSIGALITENARRWDRLPAVLFEDRVLTHGELERRSNRLAHGLADDALGCVALALRLEAKVLVAPAMNGSIASDESRRQAGHPTRDYQADRTQRSPPRRELEAGVFPGQLAQQGWDRRVPTAADLDH